MIIKIEHKKNDGTIDYLDIRISRAAFVKHAAFAGYYETSFFSRIRKTCGFYLMYKDYINSSEFDMYNKFSVPPIEISEPTEKGHFSNITGKAVADFLSKKIDKSLYTVNYEAAMSLAGIKIKHSRPDLLAFTSNKQFAIEAKGYAQTKVSNRKMIVHKQQAQSGPISVDFFVASITYGLYSEVKCKYHDPTIINEDNDEELLTKLTKQYYSDIYSYYREFNFQKATLIQGNEKFLEMKIDNYLGLIIPANIKHYAQEGINKETRPFDLQSQDDNTYIDRDRIGIKLYK